MCAFLVWATSLSKSQRRNGERVRLCGAVVHTLVKCASMWSSSQKEILGYFQGMLHMDCSVKHMMATGFLFMVSATASNDLMTTHSQELALERAVS
mmetsp:Transcript_17216/g.43258  ORF Transcript_17216/g.43258 Transcript_17216/m.43258 type:complete len:96 (-) Transcript_17216:529-816(-)